LCKNRYAREEMGGISMVRNFTTNMFDSKNQIIVFRSNGYEGIIEHKHDFVEIIYVLDGEGLHMIKDKEIVIKRGDLFIITTDDSHSIVPAGDSDKFEWINCVIDREILCNVSIDISPEQVFQTMSNKYIHMLILNMEQEYQNKNHYYQECIKGYALALISQIKRQAEVTDESFSLAQNRKDMYITETVNYIHGNYGNKIKLSDIALQVGISVGYLERIFREERATSPIEYTNIYRIEQACSLLLNTKKSINQICYDVGFNDMKNFYQIFKRQTGTSPGVFRRVKTNCLY